MASSENCRAHLITFSVFNTSPKCYSSDFANFKLTDIKWKLYLIESSFEKRFSCFPLTLDTVTFGGRADIILLYMTMVIFYMMFIAIYFMSI